MERIVAHGSPDFRHAVTLKQVEGYGESTVLFTTDASLDRMVLARAAREMGAPEIAIARYIVVVDQMPLTGNGKIDYVTLQRRAENHAV